MANGESLQQWLNDQARAIIDSSRYLTLGTADADGRPWVSPVWFAPHAYDEFFWVSSPDTRHSRNLAGRPDIAITMFDSTVPVGGAAAVYMTGRAAQVDEAELERGFAVFTQRLERDSLGRAWSLDEVLPPAKLRLYQAKVTEHHVLVGAGHPDFGSGIDRRERAYPADA